MATTDDLMSDTSASLKQRPPSPSAAAAAEAIAHGAPSTSPTTSLPSPPFIEVPNINNFRALLISNTSTPILYRSAFPADLTPTGIQTLHDLHITTIYDLRSNPEIEKSGPGPEVPGIQRIHTPVFSNQEFSPEAIALRYQSYATDKSAAGFVKAYTTILESGVSAFTTIFTHIRDSHADQKCLIHCTAGKDRTGVLCALLLLLAGCTDDEIAEEYALTELGLRGVIGEFTERLLKVEALRGNREGAERMVGARRENMIAFVEVVREDFGGVEGYLRGRCGFGDGDLRVIREKIGEKIGRGG